MPPPAKWKLKRLYNLSGTADAIKSGLKRTISVLSPRKKRRVETEKENKAPASQTIIDLPNDSQFFTAPSQKELVRDLDQIPTSSRTLFSFFRTSSPLSPASAPVSSQQCVPIDDFLSIPSNTRRFPGASVEDVDDDDLGSVRHKRVLPEDCPYILDDADEDPEDNHDDDLHSPESERRRHSATSTGPSNSRRDAPESEGRSREAPPVAAAVDALNALRLKLRPKRAKGSGYTDPGLDPFVRSRMEGMQMMLSFYTNQASKTYGHWGASSLQSSVALLRGTYCARILRRLVRQFITDRTLLPINPFGDWNQTMLVNEDLALELNIFLQEYGKDITALKLLEYLARPDVKDRHGITRTISLRTCQRYLKVLGYRWKYPAVGQYVDGHEREDVVIERDTVFIPKIKAVKHRIMAYTREGLPIPLSRLPEDGELINGKRVILWFHDESIFYAHDRRRKSWFHVGAPAKPYAKGEGVSLMIADFVSADFGWLRSPDGKRSAQRILRPGKNRDGYFTSEDILSQAGEAINILTETFPDDLEHMFIYDNATTHKKRPEDALSARKMSKGMSKPGKNWLIEVTEHDGDGKPVYLPSGRAKKIKIKMADGEMADGTRQSLYHECGEHAGLFKGMAEILIERGFDRSHIQSLRAQCKDFKCAPNAKDCCCRRLLFNQPDFANSKSLLEGFCEGHGVQVIFLPKFHCELNPIEQCWGYAKRLYRLNPESSREDALERNALASLEAIPLLQMRRFFNRAYRFMDAYERGLNGRQAAWASRRYRGHRVLPDTILDELETHNVT